jgi:uncharacterized protein (TIGR00255 family)
MTGFGHAERSLDGLHVTVDIKTVNSRFLDHKIHMSRDWLEIEPQLKAEIQKFLTRGRADVFVDVQASLPQLLKVDEAIVEGYITAADRLRALGAAGSLSVEGLLGLPGVVARSSLSLDLLRDPLLETLREALGRLAESRRVEGAALQEDITKHLNSLESHVQTAASAANRIREHYLERLKKQIAALASEVEIDERRLAQEVFFYVERSDISEELARLASHIERFRHYLAQAGEESVGKNLDFLCQEIHREVNTILSKSSLVDLTSTAVEAKAEVEKIREQVQNVE